MKNKAWPIIAWGGLGLGSFALWLFFRPLMLALGVWSNNGVTWQGETCSEYLLQLLNAAYLLLSNGLLTVAILSCAGLFGIFLLRRALLRSGQVHQVQLGVLIPFALGLGLTALSLVTFLLGWAGLLNRGLFVTMLIAMAISGLASLGGLAKKTLRQDRTTGGSTRLLMVLIPLMTLALVAAMVPPGILWAHDGRGYDALEYHLQLPREYLQADRIAPVEHNVFSYFPANAEMLYLLAMILRRDYVDGAYLGQMINFALAVTFVVSVYLLLRNKSPRAAAMAAIVVAGPQLFFVATNAYVECFMLLMFLLALCSVPYVRKTLQLTDAMPISSRAGVVLTGIFVGAACGCKYTAVIMIVPVVLLFLIQQDTSRLKNAAICLFAAAVTFSPWLIRNVAYARNPFFPLAAKQLGQAHWTDEQVTRWQKSVRPGENQKSAAQRSNVLAKELFHAKHFGGAVLLALAVGLLGGRQSRERFSLVCLAALLVHVILWVSLTHLQTRFLLPIVVPCALMIGGTAQRRRTTVLALLAIAVAAGSTWFCAAAYNRSTAEPGDAAGFHPLLGRDDVVMRGYPFSNPEADYGATKVLLLGEARPFYVRSDYVYNTVFDRGHYVEQIGQKESVREIYQQLQADGITHIYVNWDELARLQRSYGYGGSLDRADLARLTEVGIKEVSPTEDTPVRAYGSLYELVPATER